MQHHSTEALLSSCPSLHHIRPRSVVQPALHKSQRSPSAAHAGPDHVTVKSLSAAPLPSPACAQHQELLHAAPRLLRAGI